MDRLQNDYLIKLSDIKKEYKGIVALRGIDLEIKRGELFGLIGPDGAGKSSLMKIVAGVLKNDSGTIEIFNSIINSEKDAEIIKEYLGFMPQGLGLNLYGDLSIEENIDFFAKLKLVPKDILSKRKDQLLKVTRLEKFKDRPMKNLSGGMKQKLGLVCSLIHGPKLIVLDEPTTGVDPVSRRDFWAILHELVMDEEITALISTAYMDEADRFNRVALMNEGNIIAVGNPDSIKSLSPGTIVNIETNNQIEVFNLIKNKNQQTEIRGKSIRTFVDEPDEKVALNIISKLLINSDVGKIESSPAELEDNFVAILRNKYGALKPSTAKGSLYDEINNDANLAIEANDLSKNYDSFKAVDHVSFSVNPGEVLGLLGANGAGKTTVIKMLTGIVKPTSGIGKVDCIDINSTGTEVRMHLGYMSQAFSLYHDLSVTENLSLYCSVYGLNKSSSQKRISQILEIVELKNVANEKVFNLPMGIRQRLALACSLVHQPKVIFLDEPTSGVDPIGRRNLWEIIHRLSREFKVAILVTTHYMSEAEHCDRIVLMYAGRVVEDATPSSLKIKLENQIGLPIEIETKEVFFLKKALDDSSFKPTLHGNKIRIYTKNFSEDIKGLETFLNNKKISFESIKLRQLSMEDVFVKRVTELEESRV